MTSPQATPRVCAVVVTFRRVGPLRECLRAIANQTRPVDHLLVVDNASHDSTVELVRREFPAIEVLELPDNRGGAGGFHAGIEKAMQGGYDAAWVMDDDGVPDARQLELLCERWQHEGAGVYGPVCVRPDDAGLLSFPSPFADEYGGSTTKLSTLESALEPGDAHRVLRGWASFMNGVLVPREAVERAGLPRAEMFIWGDEVEYAKRIKAHDLPLVTVFDARHVHPADRIAWTRVWRPSWTVYSGPHDWKAFCFFRNSGLIAKLYGRGKGASMIARYVLYFWLMRRGDVRGWRFFWRAYRAGWREDFSRRVPY